MGNYYQPEIETASREDILKIQNEKIVKQVRHVYDNVPYYRDLMDKKGVKPEDIKGVDDIRKLPFLSKADLREAYPYGLLATPLTDCVRIQSTSGTTGKRVVAFYTQHDVDLWEDCTARAIDAAGGNEDDTWGYKDFFVRMALVDDTYPTLYNDSTAAIGVGPGPYRKGNTFYISVPFNEIVYSSGTSKRIDTTWGSAYYDSGDGSNVITFKGTITASAGTVLEITGGTCNFRDLSYNYFQGSLNRTFNGKTVSASHAYPISYDLGGGTLPANAPTSYTYDAAVSLVQPTRMGYAFAGWTGSNGSTKQKYVTIYSGSYGPRSYVAH